MLQQGLYLITPDWSDSTHLLQQLEAVLRVGPVLLQYRNKSLGPAACLQQAQAVAALCRDAGVPLIVNDDAELARAVRAAGVHLGQEDGAVSAARALLGPRAIIGVSCYASVERALQAQRDGADYVAFGAVFPSSTKPNAVRAPLSLFATSRAELALPRVAIGGIQVDNAAEVIAAGADQLAVISDVFESADPVARAATYVQLFTRAVRQ
mgnify:CR=1 FL=1